MKIQRVMILDCRWKLSRRGTYTEGNSDPPEMVSFIVSVTDGRATGYGECIPSSMLYSKGHLGRADNDEWKTLLDLCRRLPGQDARRLGLLVPDELRSYDTNSVIDAVDFALHDLVGVRLGVPVAVLLGGVARRSVRGMPVVHNASVEAMVETAVRWYGTYGFRYYKLKPIGDPDADEETLRKIIERTGPEVRFCLDANYALKMTPDQVISYINRLHPHGLEVYEDPIDVELDVYRYMRGKIRAGLMLDDKARTPEDILRIIRAKAADRINIHADWAGGFQAGIRKAQLAWAAGISAMVGSTYYFGPGTAAYQTLSSVLPGNALCEQMPMHVYGMPDHVPDLYRIENGRIHIPDRPGLGITPGREALERHCTRKEEFS